MKDSATIQMTDRLGETKTLHCYFERYTNSLYDVFEHNLSRTEIECIAVWDDTNKVTGWVDLELVEQLIRQKL